MAEREGRAEDLRTQLKRSPFHGWAGMSVLDAGPGTVEIALDAAPHHLNLQGVLHGGMIATLADTAAGLAVRAVPPSGGSGADRGPGPGAPDRPHARARGG